jgi:hypothetical protein
MEMPLLARAKARTDSADAVDMKDRMEHCEALRTKERTEIAEPMLLVEITLRCSPTLPQARVEKLEPRFTKS